MSPRILTERERTMVEAVATYPGDATVLRRAQALLWRDEGESIAEVGERLGVSRRTICYWQAHFREHQALELTAPLREGHRSGRPPPTLGIELRFLPKATPELNAMDHLWRHVKGRSLADRTTRSVEDSANQACQDILSMTPHERLRKAGVFSGNFWLTM